jgi:hypothetical protein
MIRNFATLATVIFGLSSVCTLAQDCSPVPGHSDTGTIEGAVLSSLAREVRVKSKGEMYDLQSTESQSSPVRNGDLVRVQYKDLMNCYRLGNWVGSIISITKIGRDPRAGQIPPEAKTIQGRVVTKETTGRLYLKIGRGNPMNFDVSPTDPVFSVLRVGDLVRVTYLLSGCSGPNAEWCRGTALRISRVAAAKRKVTAQD